MKTCLIFIIIFLSATTAISSNDPTITYLSKVLSNLEKIKSATYYSEAKAWEPGDTIPLIIARHFYKEYSNPKDTTIGSSSVVLDEADTTKLEWGYNGEVSVTTYHDKKVIMIDDFTHRNLPFRLAGNSFFNYTKSIIRYTLETADSITTKLKEFDEYYYFKLLIHEDTQVEFFGKGIHMPKPPFDIGDPTSGYELWIDKSTNLPYKFRREMSHSISSETCSDVKLNHLSIDDFDLFSYFPKDYEIRKYGETKKEAPKPELLDKKAPDWTLKDANGQTVSFSNFKGKVLLIEFTGIGCGPCVASIPFLNTLEKDFAAENVEVVAIETWNRKAHSLQNYAKRHHITYKLLAGNDEVTDAYQAGRSAPVFYILDEQRIIRKVIKGYRTEATDKEILGIIKGLL